MTTTSDADRLAEAYRDRGLSPEAARLAARGRSGTGSGTAPASRFDALVENFCERGLTPEAARQAAIGRDGYTESAARAAMDQAAHLSTAGVPLTESQVAPIRMPLREVRSPGQAMMLVAEVATNRLGMKPTDARAYAKQLMERELDRGGYAHTLTWLRNLAEALDTRHVTT